MKAISNWSEWKFVIAVDTIAVCIVSAAIVTLYPPELWHYEISLSVFLTLLIASPATYFMASQVRKNQELSAELQKLLNQDWLTAVYTRQYFFDKMSAEPEAYGTAIMVDIDNFKRVNDTHGHFAGDKVIQDVAQMLEKNVRENDIVARFGGEEFIVFLNSQDQEAAYTVAERMRTEIAAHNIRFKDINLDVTVSIGGSLKEKLDDLDLIIQEADEALYKAKRAGRNKTVFANTKKRIGKCSLAAEPATPTAV